MEKVAVGIAEGTSRGAKQGGQTAKSLSHVKTQMHMPETRSAFPVAFPSPPHRSRPWTRRRWQRAADSQPRRRSPRQPRAEQRLLDLHMRYLRWWCNP